MELDTGLTLISATCTVATICFTLTSKKYFARVQEYFQVVKKNEINSCLKIAVAEMKKFGAGCTEASIKGLSQKSHSNTCAKVQDLLSELRRNKKSLDSKSLQLDSVITQLDSLLTTFSQTTVINTKLLMLNGKPLYDKLSL